MPESWLLCGGLYLLVVPPGKQATPGAPLPPPLGEGASGVTYLARELGPGGTGQTLVAIKRMHRGIGPVLEAFWKERTALRLSDVPHVGRLLDDFEENDHLHLVMQYCPGTPFGETMDTTTWESMRPEVERLLVAVATLHARGIVHGDLKPDNVHVDGEDLWLLDLGLAAAPHIEEPTGSCGSDNYAPPEQIGQGVRDPRVDVFASGVMILERLAGFGGATALDERRLVAKRRLLGRLLGNPEVAETLVSMLAADPNRRPANAIEVVEALMGERSPFKADFLRQRLPAQATAEELEQICFLDDHRVALLGHDAAELLHPRTGGRRESVLSELDTWLKAGVARRQGDLLRLDPLALASLLAGQPLPPHARPSSNPADAWPADGIMAHIRQLREVRDAPDAAMEAGSNVLVWSTNEISQGRLRLVPAVLIWALRGIRRSVGRDQSGHMLHSLIRRLSGRLLAWALEINTREACDLVLSALEEQPHADLEVSAMRELLRARRCYFRKEVRRVRQHLDLAGTTPLVEEEAVREHMRLTGQLRFTEDKETLGRWLWTQRAWARAHPDRYICWRDWIFLALYQRRDYAAAARVARRTDQLAGGRVRPVARLNYILSLIDSGDMQHAAAVADELFTQGRDLRLPMVAAGAGRLARMARLYAGRHLPPDEAWMEEVGLVSRSEVAWAGWTEALAAWRSRKRRKAVRLAEGATSIAKSLGRNDLVTMLSMIPFACGKRPPLDERQMWVERAKQIHPLITIQMITVLWGRPSTRRQSQLRNLLRQLPASLQSVRYGVLSAKECEQRLQRWSGRS